MISLRERMVLGVAQHASGQVGIALVPAVERRKAGAQPLVAIRDRAPRLGVGQRIALDVQSRAGQAQAALVGEMRIERVALHAGALGHHAEGRLRRADAAVQLDRGLDDALPGLRLLLGAALEGVGPGHLNLTTQ